MINADEKQSCLKEIENAYHSMEFYQELKEKDELPDDFVQTAFSLMEHMISKIAKTFDLDSKVKEQLEERSKENRNRNLRIQQLEKQLSSNLEVDKYKENVSKVFDQIEKIWQAEGFSATSKGKIKEYGDIEIYFDVRPIKDSWELVGEEDTEETLEKYKETFRSHAFNTITSQRYEYIVDKDENKEKIEALLKQCFPFIEIWNWETRKEGEKFVLLHVCAHLSNLSFLEEKR